MRTVLHTRIHVNYCTARSSSTTNCVHVCGFDEKPLFGSSPHWCVFESLPAEAVQRAALALERVHDVERRHRLAASVLRVRHGIAHDGLKEHLPLR